MDYMNRTILFLAAISAAGLGTLNTAVAQGLPTTQPKLITIYCEQVKVGLNAEHAKHEAGWPAAYEKAKSPDYYLAMTSLTGPNEAWYVIPSESHAAFGEAMKREDKDPVLGAKLAKLARGDAKYISGARGLQAIAQPELSVGEFPDLSKARFYEITVFRVRPGHETQFVEAAKTYGAARKRAAPDTGYRVYQVIAGMPGPAYLAMSSVEDYGRFDRMLAADTATWQAATPEEQGLLQKAGAEALISTESNRFRVDPRQSYVPKETREKDSEFWKPK
jgi:hypothetical protein